VAIPDRPHLAARRYRRTCAGMYTTPKVDGVPDVYEADEARGRVIDGRGWSAGGVGRRSRQGAPERLVGTSRPVRERPRP
jgi:hypothetical protein